MDDKNLITLSNGIVLKMKPMPPLLLNAIANSIPEPEIPMVYIEDDNRHEANPNHPVYQQALLDRANNIGLRLIDAILSIGTELVSVPDGYVIPEDDSWLRRARLAYYEFDKDDKAERYLAWIRFYAVETQEDLNRINSIPSHLAGVEEKEVETVIKSFRSGEERGADNGISGEIGDQNGHNVPVATAGPRTRNRRA